MVSDVILTGQFDGDLETFGCLTVASGGVAKGSIDAGALVLEPGNRVEARVKIGPKTKPVIRAPEEPRVATGGFWSGRISKLKEFALGRK
jgi:cytoskeletal protein CcmA (bactofilin family)